MLYSKASETFCSQSIWTFRQKTQMIWGLCYP